MTPAEFTLTLRKSLDQPMQERLTPSAVLMLHPVFDPNNTWQQMLSQEPGQGYRANTQLANKHMDKERQ